MSVFYDKHGRDGGYEPHGAADRSRARRTSVNPRRQSPPRRRAERADTPPRGASFERAEAAIQLVLAFALVGGATAALHATLFAAPPSGAPVSFAALSSPTPPPSPAVAAPRPAPDTAPGSPQAASVTSPPVEAADAVAPPVAPSGAAAMPASFFDARPVADRVEAEVDATPRPLAPPSPEAREKLVVKSTPSAPPASESAAIDDAAPAVAEAGAEGGRLTKCYLKLAGAPHENSDCRIRQSGEKVVFEFADRSLVFIHERGPVWTATMGDRSFGKVRRNAHKPCWGTRGSGFYACDNT